MLAKKSQELKSTENAAEADVNKITDETESNEKIAEAEELARKILEDAETKAAEKSEQIINEAEKRIMAMFNTAQAVASQPPSIIIQQPEEEDAQLPDYIKAMQQDMMKDTTLTLFEDGDKYVNDKFISVNGIHRYQIKRGVPVRIPGYIRDINDFSEGQDTRTNKLMKRLEADNDKELVH